MFERAIEVEGICFHLAGDKEENSPAECSGAARCLGEGDPGHPKDIISEVTQERWLLCHEILNGFYTCTTYHKRPWHDQCSPSHLWLTSPNLALNKIEVVYLDYVFTVTYNVLGFPNWMSTLFFYQSLCQEYIVTNIQPGKCWTQSSPALDGSYKMLTVSALFKLYTP